MITERVSWVGHVHLVQCNLDTKFCDIDSKSELWCVYVCAGVGLSEQPTMNKTFPSPIGSSEEQDQFWRDESSLKKAPLPHT